MEVSNFISLFCVLSLITSYILPSETITYQRLPEGDWETIKTRPVKASLYDTPQDTDKAAQEERFRTFRANEKIKEAEQKKAAIKIQNLARRCQSRKEAKKRLQTIKDDDFTAAFLAKDYTEMTRLLNDGANINQLVPHPSLLKGPFLERAIQRQDLTLVHFLIETGADVNVQGHYGVTPLWMATLFARVSTYPSLETARDIVFQLVKAGAELSNPPSYMLNNDGSIKSEHKASVEKTKDLVEQTKEKLILQQKRAIGALAKETRPNTKIATTLVKC